MNVTKIAIVKQKYAQDIVYAHTDLPEAIAFGGNLTLRFDCAKDTGEKYVRDNFGIEPKVIES